MAYKILNTDGTTLLTLADNIIDQSSTSLSLIGKNYSNYGDHWNNNLIKLLANFASSSSSPPRSPLKGQLWYDTTTKRLKIYDNGFKNVSGATVASSRPTNLQTGDLWFNSTTRQLNISSGSDVYLIGPAYPSVSGIPDQSWIIPPSNKLIKSRLTNIPQDTLVLKCYGNVIAVAFYGNEFALADDSISNYMPQVTEEPDRIKVVSGITIPGDLQVYGKVTNRFLSATLNIDIIVPFDFRDMTNVDHIRIQNSAISNVLDKMFPYTPADISDYHSPGLPENSVARVAVHRSNSDSGLQVRLFKLLTTGWAAWTGVYTIENIIE